MKIYNEVPHLTDTAVALGCFDGIHLGHQAVIRAANGSHLCRTVLTFADGAPIKNGAPRLITFEEKCRVLETLGVEHLIALPFETVREKSPELFFHEVLLEQLGAKLVACGENYRFGKNAAGTVDTMRKLCEKSEMICKVVPPVMYNGDWISSSRIRDALMNGEVSEAGEMLGRLFSYQWEVVHGRQLGRTLGTPTINQYFPDHFLIPRYGVYASVTEWNGQRYHSVTNIGVKPTVGWHRPLSETWIPDFSGDLYGQQVQVSLVQFMRDECRFDSVEELKQSILQDGVKSKALTEKFR